MTNGILTHVCQVSLSALTGSDAVAYVGEALDGLGDGVPDELDCLRPLAGAVSVITHKSQNSSRLGKLDSSIHLKSLAVNGKCHS